MRAAQRPRSGGGGRGGRGGRGGGRPAACEAATLASHAYRPYAPPPLLLDMRLRCSLHEVIRRPPCHVRLPTPRGRIELKE